MSAVKSGVAKRIKVLVVDDDPNAAELVGALLELQGHEVFTARGPLEALSLAARLGPDLAFLDIGLPKMTGFELADAIRGLPGMNACRFVAITGFDDSDDEHRGRISGFEGRLLKPVAMETLARAVLGPFPKHKSQIADSSQ
jgi:CheY-like chemotaxis protein